MIRRQLRFHRRQEDGEQTFSDDFCHGCLDNIHDFLENLTRGTQTTHHWIWQTKGLPEKGETARGEREAPIGALAETPVAKQASGSR